MYPNHGVCLVEEISTKSFAGNNQELFVLRLLSNNSKVMVPKENLELVGLRPLCSKAEIDALFAILENGDIDTYKDWKGRYKQNLDKMKTGQLTEVAEVLKNLCLVSQKKSLSFREKKMYERAKFFIVSEVAHVRDVSEAESERLVEGLLAASLEKLRQRQEEEKQSKAKKDAKRAGKPADGTADEAAPAAVAAPEAATVAATASEAPATPAAADASASDGTAAPQAARKPEAVKKKVAAKATKPAAKAASRKRVAAKSAAEKPAGAAKSASRKAADAKPEAANDSAPEFDEEPVLAASVA